MLPFVLLSLFILGGYSTPSSRPKSSGINTDSAVYEKVLKAETLWEDANLHRDGAALAKVLSPQFVQINEDGSVTARDEALAKLQSSGNRPAAYRIDKRKIVIHTDTTILTAEYTEVGQSPKGYYRVVLNIADVFRYSHGEWKGEVGYAHIVDLKSGQSAPIPLNSGP